MRTRAACGGRAGPGTASAPARETGLGALIGWPFPCGPAAAAEAQVAARVRNDHGARNTWAAAPKTSSAGF